MTVLHLGVNDIPYVNPGSPAPRTTKTRKGKSRRQAAPVANETTGDVATILEDKYHIMQTFVDRHLPEIAEDIAGSMAGALESIMLGAPAGLNPFGDATDEIKKKFSLFLFNKEMDGTPGVPTKASLDGVSHRMKGKKGIPGRPSFIDTGTYEAQFQSWIDE